LARNSKGSAVTKVAQGRLVSVVPLATHKLVTSLRFKCETSPLGTNAASGRFRVFKEGVTKTDFGLSIMNPKIGKAVIAAFESRGNDMPIDLRHGMLAENPTLAQSEAYGWIPCPGGLEYVNGDGLYATRVKWDPQVKAGLESDPPRWKYFSPTYDVDQKTRAVLSLTNIALTNLPATHGLNRLAAERGTRKMNLAELGKLLAMLMAKADAGDQEAAAMRDALIAGLGDQVDAALAAAKAGDVAVEDDITAGMSEEDKASYAAMSDSMKALCAAGIKAQKAESAVDDKKEVAAEKKPEDEPVAASITAEQFDLMAKGELAEAMAPRQKIVAELVSKNLVKRGGQAEKLLLDPSIPEETFVKMVAARKSTTVTIPAKVVPSVEAPSTKTKVVSIHAEKKLGKLAEAFNVDPNEVRKKLQARG
jgi:phage I-like protein